MVRLGYCIAPTVATTAHAQAQPVVLAPTTKLITTELSFLVRMDDCRAI